MIGSEYFRGYARINLDGLYFDHKLGRTEHRSKSKKNIKRLVDLFHEVGCHNEAECHSVSATVSVEVLNEALEESNLQALPLAFDGSADDPPLLNIARVNCLNGLHRVLAAKEFLKDRRWWTVRLYASELPESDAKHIVANFSHEQKESDGDIFRKILLNKGNESEEQIWRGRLTKTKKKDLKQLLNIPGFAKSFDSVKEIPGLWSPLELGSLHRLLTLRCDEEILCALEHVGIVWNQQILFGVDPRTREFVDPETVRLLEGLAPASSEDDLNTLRGLMHSKRLFPKIVTASIREMLLGNISKVTCMIPTLHYVFEGIKYLEPACDILKRLVGPDTKKTIRQSLMDSYSRPSQPPVEIGEGCYANYEWASLAAQKSFLYLQLWVFCFRNFYHLSSFTPRKERGKSKPSIRRSNPALEHRLGDLAVRSGFATETAIQWQSRIPEQALANHMREDIEIGLGEVTDDIIGDVASVMKRAHAIQRHAQRVTFFDDKIFERERRTGRPFDDDYKADQKTFFLLPLLGKDVSERSKPYITSCFVRRNLIVCFFCPERTDPSYLLPDNPSTEVLNREDVQMVEDSTPSFGGHTQIRPNGTPNPNTCGHEDQIDNLSAQLDDLSRQLQSTKRLLRLEKASASACKEDFETLKRSFDELKSENSLLESRIGSYEDEANFEAAQLRAEDEQRRLKDNNQALEAQNQALQRDVQTLEEEQRTLVEENTNLKSANQDLQGQLAFLDQDFQYETEKVTEKRQELSNLRMQLEAQQKHREEASDLKMKINDELAALRESLAEKDKQIIELQELYEKQQQDGIANEHAISKAQEDRLKQELMSIQKNAHERVHALEEEIKHCREQFEKEQQDAKTKECATATEKEVKLKAELTLAQERVHALEVENEQSLEQFKKKQQDTIANERAIAKEQQDQLEKDLVLAQERVRTLEVESEQSRKQVEKQQEEADITKRTKIKEQEEELKKELFIAQERVRTLEEDSKLIRDQSESRIKRVRILEAKSKQNQEQTESRIQGFCESIPHILRLQLGDNVDPLGKDSLFLYLHFILADDSIVTFHFERARIKVVLSSLVSNLNLVNKNPFSLVKIWGDRFQTLALDVFYLVEASRKLGAIWIGTAQNGVQTSRDFKGGKRQRLDDELDYEPRRKAVISAR